jgi:hypothetical protein
MQHACAIPCFFGWNCVASTDIAGAIKELKELFGLAVDEGLDARE